MAAGIKTISLSGDGDIDALLGNNTKDATSPIVWNIGNLTYSFPTSASVYSYSGEPGQQFQAFPANLEDAARQALAIYSQYVNLAFSEITETSSTHADIRLAMAALVNAGGRGYFPGDDSAKSGDVWLDTGSFSLWFNPVLGSNGFQAVMHEIGHALGLSHPGFSMDPTHFGWDYTIMNYAQYPTATKIGFGEAAETPMLADVAALQYMYCANFNTHSENTTYQWSPTSGEMFINGVGQGAPLRNTIYMTLWDGGGIDTYDFSNYTSNVTADLRPGEWSSPAFFSDDRGANQVADLNTARFAGDPIVFARGSIANAYLYNGDTRSLIENAIGGSGNDTLIGNQGNNVLTGNGGDDTFFYTGGIDTFNGGTKSATGDTADFSMSAVGVVVVPVVSTIPFRLPNGTFTSFIVSDTSSSADLSGNAYDVSYFTDIGPIHLVDLHGIENITGSAFADIITGNLGDNVIKAGDGNDQVFYTGGFDTIDAGNGTDSIDFSKFGAAVSVTLHTLVGVAEAYTTDTTSIAAGTSLRAIADLAGFENVNGTPFDDALLGNGGNNKLDGGA